MSSCTHPYGSIIMNLHEIRVIARLEMELRRGRYGKLPFVLPALYIIGKTLALLAYGTEKQIR